MNKNNPIEDFANEVDAVALSQNDDWYSLLCSICDASGNDDTYKLAHLICDKTGKCSAKEIESTARNIINWRNGSHIPHRKNFRILTEVLEIGQDKELLATWNRLYSIASKRIKSESDAKINNQQKAPFTRNSTFNNQPLAGIAVGLLLAAIIAIIYQFSVDGFSENTAIPDWHDNNISWRKEVVLKVDEKVVVHGHRGECGKIPPQPQVTERRFPKLETGTLLVGDLGVRLSRQCNGPTPAREVVFHAKRPGTETFLLFDDDITVIVSE